MQLGHTIRESREKYPEITDEMLCDLRDWTRRRGLLAVPDEQLALFAHSCYFDLKATKQCMDVYYRMKFTIPEFFGNRDSRHEAMQFSLNVL